VIFDVNRAPLSELIGAFSSKLLCLFSTILCK
jgi:hypothetical protein